MGIRTVDTAAFAAVRRLRTGQLIFVHLFAFVSGLHGAAQTTASLIDPLFSLAFSFSVVLACVNDGRLRNTPILPIAQFVMLFTWPLSAPIYLVWSRGWWGVLWAMMWITSTVFCLIAGGMLGVILRGMA